MKGKNEKGRMALTAKVRKVKTAEGERLEETS